MEEICSYKRYQAQFSNETNESERRSVCGDKTVCLRLLLAALTRDDTDRASKWLPRGTLKRTVEGAIREKITFVDCLYN